MRTTNNHEDMTRRLLAPCGDLDSTRESVRLDISGLVCRLLLFETYILESIRLLEIPALVRLFGYGGFLELLESGVLEIKTGGRGICVVDSTPPGIPTTHPGVHTVRQVGFADPVKVTNENLATALRRLDLRKRERDRLGAAVRNVLRVVSPDGTAVAQEQLQCDLLRTSDEVRMAVSMALRRKCDIETGIDDFDLEYRLEGDGAYRHVTNLGKVYGLDIHQVHGVLENAIVAMGGLETRIEAMERLQAIAGFTGDDLPLFECKLGMLYRAMVPEKSEASLRRVLGIARVPVPEGAEITIDAAKLLKIRESAEHREFINWLPKAATLTDEEIQDAVASFGARASTLIHGPMGKVARFLAVTGIGAIPGAGMVLGAAAGALDTFLLKRLIPCSGLATFVNRQYPSLFQK